MSIVIGVAIMLVLYIRRFKSSFDEEQRTIFLTAALILFVLFMLIFWLTHRV